MLKYVLLGFLNYTPMTGYELKQFMDESTANFWHAKQSQIYTTLKKLEEEGMLESHILKQDGTTLTFGLLSPKQHCSSEKRVCSLNSSFQRIPIKRKCSPNYACCATCINAKWNIMKQPRMISLARSQKGCPNSKKMPNSGTQPVALAYSSKRCSSAGWTKLLNELRNGSALK